MRHMGNSGRIAIGAILAALALLVLTGITLHETVFVWFLAACAVAYVACVAELVIRRRHKTLAASGLGSILFIAFGIAFLRQWGLAFNPDPEALSTRVDSEHPDLYFYLAAAAGAATLLLLFAGTVLPGRGTGRRSGSARAPASGGPAGLAGRPARRSARPVRTRRTPPGPRRGGPRRGRPGQQRRGHRPEDAGTAHRRSLRSPAAKPSAAKPPRRQVSQPNAAAKSRRPAGSQDPPAAAEGGQRFRGRSPRF